jgi:hypothetical protein
MLMELFNWLTAAISSAPSIALFAAFIWGILSIILSWVFSPVRHPKIVSFGLTTSDKATVDENS